MKVFCSEIGRSGGGNRESGCTNNLGGLEQFGELSAGNGRPVVLEDKKVGMAHIEEPTASLDGAVKQYFCSFSEDAGNSMGMEKGNVDQGVARAHSHPQNIALTLAHTGQLCTDNLPTHHHTVSIGSLCRIKDHTTVNVTAGEVVDKVCYGVNSYPFPEAASHFCGEDTC